jgi:hypothetical protein
MSLPFVILLVVFSKLACAIGLQLPSGSPHQSHDLFKFAQNESSVLTDFEQWRFGVSIDGTSRAVNHDEKGPVWTISPDLMRRCAASVLTGMHDNNVDQRGTGELIFTDERLTDFLDNVDRIYIICIECARVVPTKLKQKVAVLNGRLSDECLSNYFPFGDGNHHRRVTFAHRLAITDAQANNFRHALVLEEDAIFKEGLQHFDFESVAALINDANRQWEVLRLTWYDYLNKISNTCATEHVRSCSQWVEQNTCTIPSCDLHSSAAYILPARTYDRFLTQGTGAIDGAVLNQFTQTVLTPTICNQKRRMQGEFISENLFMEHCKGA